MNEDPNHANRLSFFTTEAQRTQRVLRVSETGSGEMDCVVRRHRKKGSGS